MQYPPGIDDIELTRPLPAEIENAEVPNRLVGPAPMAIEHGASRRDRVGIDVDRHDLLRPETQRHERVQAGAATDVEKRTAGEIAGTEERCHPVLGFCDRLVVDQRREALPILAELETLLAHVALLARPAA